MYQQMIREELARMGRIGVEPRHVEAWMRSEHSTLDGLGVAGFAQEVRAAVACVDAAESGLSEQVAQSYAL